MAGVFYEKCTSVRTKMKVIVLVMILCLLPHTLLAEVRDTDLTEEAEKQYSLKINKCCEKNELMVQRGFKTVCTLLEQVNQSTNITHLNCLSFCLIDKATVRPAHDNI